MNKIVGKIEPYDLITFIYAVTLSTILMYFGGAEKRVLYNVLALGIIIALAFAIICYLRKERGGIAGFIRMTYPLFVITFLYEQVGLFINLIFPFFFDYQIINLEKSIFGDNPTILLQKISFPILNEIFSLCYFSYYFLLLVLGIYLYKKKEYLHLEKTVTASLIGYFISYITFILYPVEGPRFALAGQYWLELEGYVFVPLTQFIIGSAGLHGGCMPSSHVAIAVVATLICKKYARVLYPYYLFLTIGLIIGTFWGRFHYITDAAAGIVLGVFSVWAAEYIYKNQNTNHLQKG